MTIIVPMAGVSNRFTQAGFVLPKYMLYIKNRSLFNISVSSYNNYFSSCYFLFICRDIYETELFINAECRNLGILNYGIVILDMPTRGQAETVYLGLINKRIDRSESILITNIDTFRPGYTFPKNGEIWDGYLEVFKGAGKNWSYAKTESSNSTKVIQTAEKIEISDNCSTGIYYFKSASLFLEAYGKGEISDESNAKELYVAPLFNKLIIDSRDIHINIIPREEVIFCGTPDEYEEYINTIYNKKK